MLPWLHVTGRKFHVFLQISFTLKVYRKQLFVFPPKTNICWSPLQLDMVVWTFEPHKKISLSEIWAEVVEANFQSCILREAMCLFCPLSPWIGMRSGGEPPGTVETEATSHRYQERREKPCPKDWALSTPLTHVFFSPCISTRALSDRVGPPRQSRTAHTWTVTWERLHVYLTGATATWYLCDGIWPTS